MKALLARLLREPLVVFLLAGALLFAIDAAVAQRKARVIVLTRALRADLAREIEAEKGRPPSAAELAEAAQRWKRDEALFREGLRHGLDRNDPQVRARVAGKLREILERNALAPEPSEADLQAFLAAHRAYYEIPVRYDFEHVFVSPAAADARARADKIARELAGGGVDPATRGDAFPEGRVFAAQQTAALRQLFGERFARELAALVPDRWTVLASERGLHVVRLRRAEGGLPAREQLLPRLVADFKEAQRKQVVEQATAEILGRYRLEEER